jgi:hypothetical protein
MNPHITQYELSKADCNNEQDISHTKWLILFFARVKLIITLKYT